MRWRIVLLVCLAAVPLLSGSEWKKISSPNFELYTTSSEHDARQTIEIFERARDFFLRAKPISLAAHLPVTLIAFDTPREYKPYSPRALAPAYSTFDEQRDYVVMSDLGSMRTRAAIHEYVHLLVRDSGFTLPLWLNEGMADLYSTFETADGKVLVGSMPRDRVYSLTHDKWIRLPELVKITSQSAEYKDEERAGIFYGQSWLLAHMLSLGEGYADKFPKLLDQFSDAASSQQAFSIVYGKTLAEIEKDMGSYFRQSTIGGAAYKFEFHQVEIGPVQPVTEFETGLTLAKLLGLLGRTEEARRRMEELSVNHPNNHDIDEAMAYLEWRQGGHQAAVQRFQQAFSHGSASWKTYWDYARLLALTGSDPAPRLQALRKALELQPDLAEARLMLGHELHQMGRFADALTELRQIQNINPRQAALMYLTMADSASRLQQDADARHYAEEAQKFPHTPEQASQLERFLDNRGNTPETSPLPPAPPDTEPDPQRPILRHRGARTPR